MPLHRAQTTAWPGCCCGAAALHGGEPRCCTSAMGSTPPAACNYWLGGPVSWKLASTFDVLSGCMQGDARGWPNGKAHLCALQGPGLSLRLACTACTAERCTRVRCWCCQAAHCRPTQKGLERVVRRVCATGVQPPARKGAACVKPLPFLSSVCVVCSMFLTTSLRGTDALKQPKLQRPRVQSIFKRALVVA